MTVPGVDRLSSQVLEEIRAFQWNLSWLEALDFSNSAPEQLIHELRQEIENEQQTLESLHYFAHNPDRAVQIISSSHRNIAARIPFLGYIERAQTQHTPWSLIGSIQDLASAIIPGYSVIIASVDAHNYLVEWYPETKRLFLWLPRLHRLNVLWHTNIGHELFHPAIDLFCDEHLATVAPRIIEACKKLPGDHGPSTPDADLFAQQRLDLLVRETLDIWKRGVAEILCDFGCATIFGPASIMALLSMAQCDDLDARPEPPQYYPPWRFRFRMVRRRIGDRAREFVTKQKEGNPRVEQYFEAFSQSLDAFDAIAKEEDDKKRINAHPLCRIAYEQIEATLDVGWQHVQTLVPSTVKRWDETQDQVPALLTRLERGIPPSEVAEPGCELSPQAAHLSAIMVAGWVYESFRQLPKQKDGRYDYSTLMRLVLKGCEDAGLRRAYKKCCGKGGTE